ncbi:MAG: hypothetical protein WBW16_01410 [Bacteroidota bacterium]
MQIESLDQEMRAPTPRRRISLRAVILTVLALLLLYVLVDLFWAFHRDLRQFNPEETGKLETAMWRSYYDREPVQLFFQLAELLRTQFQFPILRSYRAAYFASRAAFVFKDGNNRKEYEQVLPYLESYFGAIRGIGNLDFNVQRAARLELEWWIVHRERDRNPPGALERACAEAAALYQVSPDLTSEHGRLRAAAMIIRDARAESGNVSEKDWMLIESLLCECYRSLHRVVAR